MDDVKKIKEIIDDICRLVAESVNGIPEKSFNDDPKFFLNSFFLKRYYYNLIAVSELTKRYQEDPFFHFPICLILRTNLHDFLIQYKFIALMEYDSNNITEIKKLLGDHFRTLSSDKETFSKAEQRYKKIFSDFVDENGVLMKGKLSAYQIYVDLKNDKEFAEESNAYNIYNQFSKIEHFGVLTFGIQDELNYEILLDRIIEAIKYVIVGVQTSLANLNIKLDFNSLDARFIEIRNHRLLTRQNH